ncbi:Nocturnin [Dipodascopsis tothii]|uniref:Nocturnin n=1 Tax=Dipodascopsis tothii TaxID=44089 RepID=UPI0034CF3475
MADNANSYPASFFPSSLSTGQHKQQQQGLQGQQHQLQHPPQQHPQHLGLQTQTQGPHAPQALQALPQQFQQRFFGRTGRASPPINSPQSSRSPAPDAGTNLNGLHGPLSGLGSSAFAGSSFAQQSQLQGLHSQPQGTTLQQQQLQLQQLQSQNQSQEHTQAKSRINLQQMNLTASSKFHPHAIDHQTLSQHSVPIGSAGSLHHSHNFATPPAQSAGSYPGHQQGQAAASSTNSALYALSQHWQTQVHLAQISRQSGSPHHHARVAAAISRQPGAGGGAEYTSASATAASLMAKKPALGGHARTVSYDPAERSMQPVVDGEKRQDWNSLDIGGQGLRSLSLALFNYTFLEKLYINQNRLTVLPSAIGKLRHLTVLDISGNMLTSLPAEIGMLACLKTLLLFDNNLTTLPYEMGALYQLEMLGIEGNPMAEPIKSTMAKDGTRGVIVELREGAPVPLPPPPRVWLELKEKDEPAEETHDDRFSVCTYNVLCDNYVSSALYGHTPTWALNWDYRRENLKQEIIGFDADVVCLQEVDNESFDSYFSPQLAYKDYRGVFWPKTRAKTMSDSERKLVDGCATFYKSSVFKLLDKQVVEFAQLALKKEDLKKTADIYNRVMTKDNVAVVLLLEHKKTGYRVVVSNAHNHWDPAFKDVKLVQIALLMEEITKMTERFTKIPYDNPEFDKKYNAGTKLPLLVCGDFNSTPDSGVYKLLSQGHVPHDHSDMTGRTYGRFTEEGMSHHFQLKSSYAKVGELSFTNWTPGFTGVIDYIWYSTNTLDVIGVMGEPDKEYMDKVVGFPNAHFPSDHISLLSQFQFKPPKDLTKPPPPDFGNSSRSKADKAGRN